MVRVERTKAGPLPALMLVAVAALGMSATRPVHAQQPVATAPAGGESVQGLAARLTDQVPGERIRAAYALAELGPAAAPAVGALRASLGDENPTVRYAAAWALGEIGSGARLAVPDLEAHARDDEVGDVRWIAAKVLRKLGVENARPGDPAPASRPDTR